MGIFGGFGGDPNAIAVNDRNVQPGLAGLLGQAQGQMLQPVQSQQAVNQYAQMPQQAPEQAKGGFFNHGVGSVLKTLLSGALDGVSMHYGGRPGGYDQMQKQAEEAKFLQRLMLEAQQAAQARQQTRQEGNEDYETRKAVDQRYQKPEQPYRFEDNAGNVWERAANGENRRIFTDLAPKQYVQDGQLVNVPNPFAGGEQPAQGGISEGQTATNPQTGEKLMFRGGQWVPAGGGASNGTGGFPGQ